MLSASEQETQTKSVLKLVSGLEHTRSEIDSMLNSMIDQQQAKTQFLKSSSKDLAQSTTAEDLIFEQKKEHVQEMCEQYKQLVAQREQF